MLQHTVPAPKTGWHFYVHETDDWIMPNYNHSNLKICPLVFWKLAVKTQRTSDACLPVPLKMFYFRNGHEAINAKADNAVEQNMHAVKKTKLFSCLQCNKTFGKKSKLDIHMRVHTSEKPYSCTVCGKSFSQSSDLNQHTRVHTGEKPFSCTLCDKSFARSAHLNQHMRVHTGKKPFSCQLCDKSFA
jgi:uncharacterized Zn-finger protein